ncbi:hypothetical protein Pan97_34870 [Bremerella volcania]|uniref:MORN repeat variant n=1 Tax=Bremerella volcania TaxID=2527984 RepID=A0A518CB43_9BACT|nr:hypothetical protein [Bremerella volcania]QDU76438.1 hypothetical protein Pan97_34870 [Bremerella volcania]
MPRFPFALLVALLAVIAGCSSNSSGQPSPGETSQGETADHPTPEIRSDGAYVYTFDGIEYPFPSVLTFDTGAWVREDIVWIDGILLGHQYAHTQRPKKMLYNITHNEDGYTVRFQEGKRGKNDWLANGKWRAEFPNGTASETIFVDGHEEGPLKLFHKNGSLQSEFELIGGEKSGSFKRFRSNGVIEASGIMEDGEITFMKLYDELGQPLAIKDMTTDKTKILQQ